MCDWQTMVSFSDRKGRRRDVNEDATRCQERCTHGRVAIPKLSLNLFSVGRFTKEVEPVTFETNGCFAETKGVKWKLGAREGKGLFKLCMTPEEPNEANVSSSNDCKRGAEPYVWHLRLGHIGHGGLDATVKKDYGTGIDLALVNKWETCSGCALCKRE